MPVAQLTIPLRIFRWMLEQTFLCKMFLAAVFVKCYVYVWRKRTNDKVLGCYAAWSMTICKIHLFVHNDNLYNTSSEAPDLLIISILIRRINAVILQLDHYVKYVRQLIKTL